MKTIPKDHIRIAGTRFVLIRRGYSKRRYLWIHGDEHTAREVLLRHLETNPGQAFLVESPERNVRLFDGRLDPNRMFSREGAEKNLRKLNPEWTPRQMDRALARLDREREEFLQAVLPDAKGLLIALHNNWEEYTVKDEVPISDRAALNDPDHPRDFFICTDESDYDRLSQSPYNVVLQMKIRPEDDGSLSPLAAKRNLRYVNIETELGEFDKQKAMLMWLEKKLP